MSIDFRVVLSVENPSQEKLTCINLAYLGNGDIKRAMLPLLSVDEEGFPTPGGELPIDADTPAFEALHDLMFDAGVDLQLLQNKLEDLQSKDDHDAWSLTYADYKGTKDFYDTLSDTVNAIRDSTDNPSISCHIFWW